MSDFNSVESLSKPFKKFTLIKRADGVPITTGTVNWYLTALTGANAGKWWRKSDETWQAAETANAMTHQKDGHWTIDLTGVTTSPYTDAVHFLEYVKESGDLHVPDAIGLHAEYTPSANSARRVDVGSVSGQSQTARDLGNALPAAAPNANGGLPILSVSGTTLGYTISVCTTNTDMRGTDGAALAANYSATRAGYLDNLQGGPVALAITALSTANWTTARAGYLDNLNVGGPVASKADVDALNQSASRRVLLATVPQYERPESGSTLYTIEARTFSRDGVPMNATGTPTLTETGQTSGNLSANLSAATNPETGVYRWTYSVASGATVEPVRSDLAATVDGDAITMSAHSQVVDLVATTWTTTDQSNLTAIFNKLPPNAMADETLVLAAIAGVQSDTDDIQTNLVEANADLDELIGSVSALGSPMQAGSTVVLSDGSLTTAKLGSFVLAKTTNITGFNDIAATSIVSAGAITTLSGAVVTTTNLTNAPPDSAGVTTLLARIPAALFSGITSLAKWLGIIAGKTADAGTLAEVNATTAGAGYVNTTDSMEALRDRGDTAWVTGTAPDNAGIAALQTTIGIGGAGLTDLGGMSTTMRSQVNAEADSALADYDGPTNAEMVARTLAAADYATAAGQATLLAAVQNVQNNTFISTSIPLTLERPDAGSATVNISIVFADETGAAKNLDSGNPIITLVNDVGTDLSSRLGMFTNPATGKYVVPYTNTVGDAIEGLHWDVSGTINGKLRRLPAYTQIVDTTAVDFTAADRTKLDAILADTDTTLPAQISGLSIPTAAENAAAVDLVLTAAHDSGSWASAGSLTDWTDAEREQIRDALGVDGDKEPAADGQLQDIPGDVDDVLTLAHGVGSWQSGSSTFGAGARHVELIILDVNSLPIAGAAVWITTGDDPETGVVAGTEVSDAFGSRNFMLDPSPIEQEGEVQSAAASSVTLEAAASSVDGAYNRKIVRITAGTGVDQSRVILDYDGSERLATLSTAWTVQPDGTSHYQVVEPYRRWAQLSGNVFSENPALFDVK